jgi:hypothetical protein
MLDSIPVEVRKTDAIFQYAVDFRLALELSMLIRKWLEFDGILFLGVEVGGEVDLGVLGDAD